MKKVLLSILLTLTLPVFAQHNQLKLSTGIYTIEPNLEKVDISDLLVDYVFENKYVGIIQFHQIPCYCGFQFSCCSHQLTLPSGLYSTFCSYFSTFVLFLCFLLFLLLSIFSFVDNSGLWDVCFRFLTSEDSEAILVSSSCLFLDGDINLI